MIRFLIHAVAVGVGLWLASTFVPGVHVDTLKTLVEAALLLAVVNALVRPILVLLTLPLTILTLGLWLLVLNAAMIWLVAHFLHGFVVRDLVAAFLCWLVVAVVSWVVSSILAQER
jgi:putative membrane protein